MFAEKRILIVVPARGGSKGLPLKNLCKVGGVTLVAWTARVIKSLIWADRAVISTDHEEIAAEAEAAGLAAPFRRPKAISGDRIGDADVLIHALREMERVDDSVYDVVVMLQPTCPLRQPSHVTATIEMLIEKQFDAVWTVSATDLKFHPLKQLVVGDNGRMTYYDPAGAKIVARQQLSHLYHRNGAAYAVSRACLLEHGAIIGPSSGAVIIRDALVNIDTAHDLIAAEAYCSTPSGAAFLCSSVAAPAAPCIAPCPEQLRIRISAHSNARPRSTPDQTVQANESFPAARPLGPSSFATGLPPKRPRGTFGISSILHSQWRFCARP